MNRNYLFAVTLAVIGLFLPAAVHAAWIWDGNGTELPNQPDATDISGTWDTTLLNWYNGSTNVAWDNNNPQDAQFGIASGSTYPVVTVDGTMKATGLETYQRYDFLPDATNGGAIELNGSTPTVAAHDRVYIEVPLITASSGVSQVNFVGGDSGNRYLYLYGDNIINTPIMVGNSDGSGNVLLMPYNANAFGGSSTESITVNSGSSISLRGAQYNVTRPLHLSGSGIGSRGALQIYAGTQGTDIQGNITLEADATIQIAFTGGGTATVSGTIGENGGSRVLTFNRSGSQFGELVLTQDNNYTGGTNVSGVTLTLDSTTPVPQGDYLISGTSTATYEGRLKINQDDTDLSNSVINFPGEGASTGQYLDLLGHKLTVKGVGTTGVTPTDLGAAVQNNLSGTLGTLIVNSTMDSSYQGIIRDGAGTLAVIKRGPNTWYLAGASTGQFTGGLTVEEGTLSITSTGKLPTSGLTNITGGTISLSLTTDTPVGPLQLTSGEISDVYGGLFGYGLVSTSNYNVQSGRILASLKGTVGLDKTTAGTVSLYSANTFTGPTSINQGTLQLSYDPINSSSGSLSSPVIEVGASGTFDVSDASIPAFKVAANQTLQGAGQVTGSVTVTSANANSYLGAGNSTTAGTLTLNNDLTTDNGANLEFHLSNNAGGTNDFLDVKGALTLPTGAEKANVVVHSLGSSLDTTTAYTVLGYNSLASASTTANLNVVNPTRYTIIPTLDTTAKEIKLTVSGSTAPLSLTWVGDGLANEWDANKTANWSDGSPPPEKFYELDTANFDNSTSNTTVNLVESLHPTAVNVDNDAAHDYTFQGSGKITGVGTTLSKSGVGTLTLDNSGTNDFTGAVTVSNGKLVLGANSITPLGDVAGGTSVTSSGGDAGTLDLNGKTLPLGEVVSIAGAGYSNQGALINNGLPSAENTVKNLTLTANATLGGISDWKVGGNSGGLLGGGFTLTKVGASNVTIDNMGETNLGDIAINEGQLTFGGSSTLGTTSGTITLADNTTLATTLASVNYQKNLTVNTMIGTCTLLADGPGSLSGTVTLNGKLTTQVNADYTFTLGSNVTGSAGIEKTGTGLLVLAGNNNYTGDTTVSDGIVYLSSSAAAGSGYYAVPKDLVYGAAGGVEVRLKDGEENGHPQLSPISTVKFSTTSTDQWFFIENHTLTVEGIDGVNDTSTSDQAYRIQSHTDSGVGTLIIDSQLSDHAYWGEMIHRGADFALIKRGSKTMTLMGSRSALVDSVTVEEGTLDCFYGMVGETPVPGVVPSGNITITGGTLKMGKLSGDIGTAVFKITDGLLQADTTPDETYTDPARLISSSTFDVQGGAIEARLGGTAGLTKSGAAEAVLKADNYYTGNTTITQGTLTLEGQGQISTSSPILNDATFRIADGVAAHTVGTISGTGTTQLNTDAQLTAASVKQGSLTIGAGAKLTIAPVVAGGGPAPVPEPGAWALLLAGLLSVAAWRRLRRP